jgi:hypothetical protein
MAKAPNKVPPVDADPQGGPEKTNLRDAIEFRLLEADAKARESVIREADQRYWLRWFAVVVVSAIIVAMGVLLNHVAHWLPSSAQTVGAVIALHLAPIASMTALAIALLVAAFRGFKEGDEKAGATIAADALKTVGFAPH